MNREVSHLEEGLLSAQGRWFNTGKGIFHWVISVIVASLVALLHSFVQHLSGLSLIKGAILNAFFFLQIKNTWLRNYFVYNGKIIQVDETGPAFGELRSTSDLSTRCAWNQRTPGVVSLALLF